MKEQYLECGRITSTHGVRGAVMIESWCDSPEILCGVTKLWYKKKDEYIPLEVTKASLSVKADDKTKVYGDGNPVLTGTLTGVKNNDAVSATYSSAATGRTCSHPRPLSEPASRNAARSSAGGVSSRRCAPRSTTGASRSSSERSESKRAISADHHPRAAAHGIRDAQQQRHDDPVGHER